MSSSILSSLNPEQQQAVIHPATPLLLLAGAGSGKTRVLTHRAAWFVESKQMLPSNLLLLTFTNKAAGEMKERLNKLLGKQANPTAGTFHSFASKILRLEGHNIGVPSTYVIYDTDDQEGLIRTILKDMDLTTKEFKISSVIYFIEKAKNAYQKPKESSQFARGFWEETASQIYLKYEKKMQEYSALDFNDLLLKTVDLFLEHPEVLEKYQELYKAILVDEYQDTNQTQYLLTKLLAKHHQNITAVGDASQSIYGWRGADYRNLSAFQKDFSNVQVLHLEQNYRSTKTILDAANKIISKNSSHPVLNLFTTKDSKEKIHVFQASSEVSEAEFVAENINSLVLNKRFEFKDFAVLYRTNAQSRTLEEAFLKLGLPYVLIGGIRFYDRAEIKDIVSMLRFLHNKEDLLSLDRVEKAVGKRKIAEFKEFASTYKSADKTTTEIIEDSLNVTKYLEKFDKSEPEDQRRLENIKELNSVASNHPHLYDFLENIALVQQEYSMQEKNKKNDALNGIRLMTLHASKGLEFEVVFLVGFEEGILPHSNSMLDDNQIEEERRLAYVGITRAKEILFITYATQRLFYGKSSLNEPSRFLADIPGHLMDLIYDNSRIDNRRQTNKNSDYFYDPDIYW